jgi:hypothetical protein
MSFGYSVGDVVALIQLAWNTYQGARKACGEHDELTSVVGSVHGVLQRLHRELANPESLLNHASDDPRHELSDLGSGCQQILNIMNTIVSKYNTLAEQKRSPKKIWKKIQFGNGEMHDLADLRSKLSTYTSAISVSLHICSLGSQGRMESQLNTVGGDLKGLTGKVNLLVANMVAKPGVEGTVWTSYEDDDKAFWRELRRGLVQEGYPSSALHKHKELIKKYVEELGSRGVFDLEEDTLIIEGKDENIEEKIAANKNTQSRKSGARDNATFEENLELWDDSDEESTTLEASKGLSRMSNDDPHTTSDPTSARTLQTLDSQGDTKDSFPIRLKPVNPESTMKTEVPIAEAGDSSFDEEKEHSTHAMEATVGEFTDDKERNSQAMITPKLLFSVSIEQEISSSAQVSEDGASSLVSSDSRKGKEHSTCEQEAANIHPYYSAPDSVSNSTILTDHRGYITFKDCVGRESTLPFHWVDTWLVRRCSAKDYFVPLAYTIPHF